MSDNLSWPAPFPLNSEHQFLIKPSFTFVSQVVSVPTVAAFRGGKVTDKFVGAVDLNKIETFVERLVGDS